MLQERDARFIGMISSREMNDIIDEMQKVLKFTYNRAEESRIFYDFLNTAVTHSLNNLATSINNLDSKLTTIENLYNQMIDKYIASKIAFIDYSTTPYENNGLVLDDTFGKIHLGYSSEIDHMLYNELDDQHINRVHKSTKIYINNSLIEDYNTLKVLFADGQLTTFGIIVSEDGSVGDVINIKLELTNHKTQLNTLLIYNMPLPGTNIRNVYIDGESVTINDHDMSQLLLLNKKQFNGVIELSCNPVEINGRYLVVLQLIKALYRSYYETGNSIFKISDPDKIHDITSLSCDYGLLDNLYPPEYIHIQIAKDANFTTVVYDNKEDPFPLPYGIGIPIGGITDIYVKVTLKKYEIFSPWINNLCITYR